MPTAGESPESWIGQRILVEIIGAGNYRAVLPLDGISEWGAVLTGEGVEPSGAAVFFPWNRVMAIRLARAEDGRPDLASGTEQ